MGIDIHKSSIISKETKLGSNVKIGPYCMLGPNVQVGNNVKIYSHVNLDGYTIIGSDTQIFPFASIGTVPQDLKYKGEKSKLLIGSNNIIREYVTMNPGTKGGGLITKIGNNCLFMIGSHVAHDCFIGNNVIMANNATLAGHVCIDDFAILGGLSAVHQFASIGKHAMVSGGALVRKDVPPFVKAAREPLSFVGINSIGLRRREFKEEKIQEIQNIYRILFQSNKNTTQALLKIETEINASPERDEIILFIQNSGRGIMKGFNQK